MDVHCHWERKWRHQRSTDFLMSASTRPVCENPNADAIQRLQPTGMMTEPWCMPLWWLLPHRPTICAQLFLHSQKLKTQLRIGLCEIVKKIIYISSFEFLAWLRWFRTVIYTKQAQILHDVIWFKLLVAIWINVLVTVSYDKTKSTSIYINHCFSKLVARRSLKMHSNSTSLLNSMQYIEY